LRTPSRRVTKITRRPLKEGDNPQEATTGNPQSIKPGINVLAKLQEIHT
jgi:hypothetical protein